MMVAVVALGHPVNMLYLSSPSPFSSNCSHSPRILRERLLMEVCIIAPVAWLERRKKKRKVIISMYTVWYGTENILDNRARTGFVMD